ncbi:glycosyltransferase family 10 [Campylobacter sp. IFREMER_LSEM_CL2101]|uniref:glycosyltransferase family 10 domain-containing protein n=1 Tax=Campylobacter sp. IFREMER_LSEM_CL2101 TaxID=2911618 RepID=UPI0021E76D73|nr:glycosyltransferase family 10 [Campylobacter sp. IFREMER_LSEM_CL2101]MCV3392121.1 glycosyltransferase family 10 [Campylobacter sp. IFREMER_LSEM_CL2101]
MQEIKIKFVDWWGGEESVKNSFIVKYLETKYKIIFCENPDYLFFSTFGKNHAKYNHCIKIAVFLENTNIDYNFTDYSIGNDNLYLADRHLKLNSFIINANNNITKHNKSIDFERKNSKFRKKFCSFLVSNGNCNQYSPRDEIFEKLCLYKKVDSGGKFKNNINYQVLDKHQWLLDYKFNLCCENSSYPGYLTEKLFDAFFAGCIPIYWGDPSLNSNINQDFTLNPKAYINAHDFNSIEDMINEIKKIDNDNIIYKKILKEPIFLNDFDITSFYTQKLESFLDNIFSQEKKYAYRRPNSQAAKSYTDIIYNAQKVNYLRHPKKLFKKMILWNKQ